MDMFKADAYLNIVEGFEAAIIKALEAHEPYEFEFYREETHLFDSTKIQWPDVLATVAEDEELVHDFAGSYRLNVVQRDEVQKGILGKAIRKLAGAYAIDEAQAYCAQDDAA